jgi:glycosyltransferase involved in cell wall biosynthesis
MYKNLLISVVIPCLNEEHGITKVLSQMPIFVDEVIVINNNSTDNTVINAQKYNARIINVAKKGYGKALKAGIKAAKGKVIITMDGDGTYSPKAIKNIIAFLVSNSLDFVSTNRLNREYKNYYPRVHLFGNKLLSLLVLVLFKRNISDILSGMMCFRSKIFPLLTLNEEDMSFSEEIKLEALTNSRIKFAQYPIEFSYHDRLGTTKLNLFKDGIKACAYLLNAKLNRSRLRR